MAELAVATTLGVVQIILPLLLKLNLPRDVEVDIEDMRSWLTSTIAFLEDNSRLQRTNSSSTQLDQIHKARKIAYDIQDVLDQFLLHSPPYTFHRHQITRKIHTYAHRLHHHFPMRKIRDNIAAIRKDINQFRRQVEAFDRRGGSGSGPSIRSSSSAAATRVSPLLRDEEMIGYEMHKTELARRLVDGERRLVRLAVDGPDGSGKSTLVKNVFWNNHIQSQFDCHAFVCVSQSFDVEEIFRYLLKQLCSSRKEPYPADDGFPIQIRVLKYLTGKRYIVVFDDVWNNQRWMDLKDALPDSNRGSRIIITTNDTSVSSSFVSSMHDHIFSLEHLEPLEGWKLFCRKAFSENGKCPSEMEDTARKILKRCEGLPLAIVAVAGALANKSLRDWEKFDDNFGREVGSLSQINDAFGRSYMNLSSSLKCCLLYMSIFPENYSVERGRLIRLWVAEGFAMATEEKTAEEVAEDYLNQLFQRNLIHVSNLDFDGTPRNCRLRNIVLEFIIKKCKDENFASVLRRDNTTQNQTRTNQMIRRLAVHEQWLGNDDGLVSIRSLLLFRLSEIDPLDFEAKLGKLNLIKVVDFKGTPLTEFPKDIERFTLVRYLSFRDTKIKMIPRSIERLSYLETLDLKHTDVSELPQEISHLQNLCHLFVYKYNVVHYVSFDSVEGARIHKGFNKLTSLQSLSRVKVGRKGTILKELKELTELRKLGLTQLKQEHGQDLCTSLELMNNLKTLDLSSATMDDYLKVEEMRNPPKSLHRLYLKGPLKRFPSWISNLKDLTRIGLKWSKLSDCPLKHLKGLSNLTELQLVECYTGEELVFERSGFKKVKILEVEGLENVNTMKFENGAMCEVKKMTIMRCRRMMMLMGVGNLRKMEELSLYDMAPEFVAGLRIDGEDREYVQHIPLIHSFVLTRNGFSPENLSPSSMN